MKLEVSATAILAPESVPTAAHSAGLLRLARVATYAAIAIGVLLRAAHFLANRSLSQDEAQLATNIMDRSFPDLFHKLYFNQAAPDGFLAVQKLVVSSFGSGDYQFRVLSFVAAIAALVWMLFLSRRVLGVLGATVAVFIFAVLDPLIYYSANDKQYAVDVFVAVAVLWLGVRLIDRPRNSSALVLFAAVGAVAIWFSHPSVFVLAAVSTVLVGSSLVRKEGGYGLQIAAASLPWLASFVIFAFTVLHTAGGVQRSLNNLPGAYGGTSGLDSGGFADTGALRTILGAFRYITGMPDVFTYGTYDAGAFIALVAAVFCAAGLVALFRRSPEKAAMVAAPLAFMLVAWGLNQYPLVGRTQLFLIPSYVLLLAEGIVRSIGFARRLQARTAIAAAAALLVLMPAGAGFAHADPPNFDEIKPVLAYVARQQQPGDTVYVFYTAQPQLRYYLDCHCAGERFEAARRAGLWPYRRAPGGPGQFSPRMLSAPPRLIVGQYRGEDPADNFREFDTLRGRVWVLLPEVDFSARTKLLHALDKRGKRLETFGVGDVRDHQTAVVVYLYEMSKAKRTPPEH